LGNHEFYREKLPGLIDELKMGAKGTNVHVLENDSVEIGGYRFFGSSIVQTDAKPPRGLLCLFWGFLT
jgi:hypothetical protein